MRRLLCLVLMTGLTLISMGESADQLFSQFQRAHGSEKVNLANQLFAVLKSEEATDTLLHFSAHTRPATIDFYVYYLMGVAYNERSQYDSAYIYCRKALNYNNKDVDSEFYNDCLSTISVTLQRKGKFHEALAYQRKCYELDLKSGNKENISSSMNNLAAIYISTKQYEQAAEFAERAVEVEKQLGRDDKLAIRYGIASEALLHYGNPTKALDYATKAYNIDHSAGREEKAAVRLSQMANAYTLSPSATSRWDCSAIAKAMTTRPWSTSTKPSTSATRQVTALWRKTRTKASPRHCKTPTPQGPTSTLRDMPN